MVMAPTLNAVTVADVVTVVAGEFFLCLSGFGVAASLLVGGETVLVVLLRGF